MEFVKKNAKIIGIGIEGIKIVDIIEEKVKTNMDIEKININQEVEKEYVRNLLDGVEILFLTYSTEDKRSKEIVKAISYMSNERKILSIGINSSLEEDNDELGIGREFKIDEGRILEFSDFMNLMVESISDSCMINIDISDLKEAILSNKGIKYSFEKFEMTKTYSEMVDTLFEEMKQVGEEFISKKGIVFVEGNVDFSLIELNDLINNIQGKIEESYEMIFSLYLKENLDGKINIGLLYN